MTKQTTVVVIGSFRVKHKCIDIFVNFSTKKNNDVVLIRSASLRYH